MFQIFSIFKIYFKLWNKVSVVRPAQQMQHRIKMSDITVCAVPVIFTVSTKLGKLWTVYMKSNWPYSTFIELINGKLSDIPVSYYLGVWEVVFPSNGKTTSVLWHQHTVLLNEKKYRSITVTSKRYDNFLQNWQQEKLNI